MPGFLGFGEAAQAVISLAVKYAATEAAVEEAFESAGNEGQVALLEGCIGAWQDYAMSCLIDGEPVEGEVLETMTDHPEAIIEITYQFADTCNEGLTEAESEF